jgi:hypothetical protein
MRATAHGIGYSEGIKVFCFFSSEKKDFLSLFRFAARETPHPGPPHNGEGEATILAISA